MNYEKYIHEGTFCWTLTSNGYKYLTWNFYKHWQTVMKHPLCIICADKPSYAFLRREGLPCILLPESLHDTGPQIVPFGSRHFSILNRVKLQLLNLFAQDSAIQTCVYLDGDIIIYKNFLPDILEQVSKHSLVFQCDEKYDCTSTSTTPCPNVCTGFLAFRHGADNGIFKISDETIWKQTPEDQVWVNTALRTTHTPYTPLPREDYPNGARVLLTHNHVNYKEKAYLLHYNYRVGESKKADMKRFGDWLLPY